eukprot:gnl/MRDRNA2_/MRDRNA2_108257_c0_seq1.p1 gnl/MRDRNA2_/MRDRNA2_108257_c0~~gnl/MRDRNA2_/MRDRNA2_108257_c0_seq1.p1  ORF type:complete len:765 (+),score=155.03 gnl/MRDRNA2_/MRDRNA2_108257_c0_seq1:80-2374(+)
METRGAARNPEGAFNEIKGMEKPGNLSGVISNTNNNNSSASPGSKSAQDGCDEFKRIRDRYPGRLPIICSRGCSSDSPNLEKKKFLVFSTMTWKDFKKTIAKHTSSRHQPHRPLKVIVGGVQPTSNTSMSDVYKKHKSIDGFLYVTVEGFAEEHGCNFNHIAQTVTSALQNVQTNSSCDHKKLAATVEQLATRVAALESNRKKIAAETSHFGSQVAFVEDALKKASGQNVTAEVPDNVMQNDSQEKAICARQEQEPTAQEEQRREGTQQRLFSVAPTETADHAFFDWMFLSRLTSASVIFLASVSMLRVIAWQYHGLQVPNQDVLIEPHLAKFQSLLEEATKKNENLAKVVQMQILDIQELKVQLHVAQQSARPWMIGSVFFIVLVLTLSAMAALFFLTGAQRKKLSDVFKTITWLEKGQQDGESNGQRDETPQEPEEQILMTAAKSVSSAAPFTYYQETVRLEEELVHFIHVQCPPGGGVSYEHIAGEILTHGIRIRINKPGDDDLPPLKWEEAFQLCCKEGSPTFDFKPEEAKLENDVLTLVFRASQLKRIWKFPPSEVSSDVSDWYDMGGGETPIGLCPLPETCSIGSGHQSHISSPARLQVTAKQSHDQGTDGDSTSQGNQTDISQISHIPTEDVQKLRDMFGRVPFEERSETGLAFMVSSHDSIESAVSHQAVPQTFDISSDAGQRETDACLVPSTLDGTCQQATTAFHVPSELDNMRDEYVGAFKKLSQVEIQSEVSSSDWEKPEILDVIEPRACSVG